VVSKVPFLPPDEGGGAAFREIDLKAAGLRILSSSVFSGELIVW
jgi:hypothetical protein